MLAELDGEPVALRQGRFIVASFHPELTDDTRIHERFLQLGRGRRVLSGHCKWSSIKHKKGAADAKRGKLFSKLSRAIIVAAQEGGPDPDGNIALAERGREGARLLDAEGQHRARDRPRRRRRRRTRGLRRGHLRGLRPERRRASIVEALTDNRNRTAADVALVFTKYGGSLGDVGLGRLDVRAQGRRSSSTRDGVDEDELMLAAADGGAEDVGRTARLRGHVRAGGSLSACGRRSRRRVSAVEAAELTMVPKTHVEVEDERAAKSPAPDRRARGERRRPGRLLQLRHPGRVLETVA